MVYRVGEMVLQQTQEVFRGKVNDVIICQDIANEGKRYYTVLVIHDRNVAKRMMELFHENGKAYEKLIADYTWKDTYLMLFEYVRERPLHLFYKAEVTTVLESEKLALNFVTECLASQIPYPILYLQLKQEQVHISRDNEVYFSFVLDLAELSMQKTEKYCATLCGRMVLNMLESVGNGKITTQALLEKRLRKDGYQRFMDLYKDLKMAAQPLKKEGIWQKIKLAFKRSQDRLFRILIVLCVVLALLALCMLVSQMIFGDVPFLKFFINPFNDIGTESMLQ